MFRTRDFILLFVTIVFLLVAIGATIVNKKPASVDSGPEIEFVDTTDEDRPVEYYSPETLDRDSRLASMRQKISESLDLMISTPELDPVPDEVLLDDPVIDNPLYCPNYSVYTGVWPVSGVKHDVAEGARIFYTETNVEVEPSSASSSIESEVKNNLLQLPLVPAIGVKKNCIPFDVVGIALDGSLIKNNEASLYGLFGGETLIGYALDGFAIYGTSEVQTDDCGGGVVNGSYSYYLSTNRDTVINCFTANPQIF